MHAASDRPARREWLVRFVQLVSAALGGAFAAILGAFAWPPREDGGRPGWLRAARLEDLTPGQPHRAVVSRRREQGWSRERTPEVVYVLWDGRREVRALSTVCTHLGCRVRWDPGSRRFRCPCHGGAYSVQGAVVAGPPPRPLAALEARIDEARGDVWIRL